MWQIIRQFFQDMNHIEIVGSERWTMRMQDESATLPSRNELTGNNCRIFTATAN